jgi:hypothetical protein
MNSFANIVSKNDEVYVKTNKTIEIESDEHLRYVLNNCNSYKAQVSSEGLITELQQRLLDKYSEDIYDLYRCLREKYKDKGLFHKVDYNRFLDIFLNSVIVEEVNDDNDMENGHNEDENH